MDKWYILIKSLGPDRSLKDDQGKMMIFETKEECETFVDGLESNLSPSDKIIYIPANLKWSDTD